MRHVASLTERHMRRYRSLMFDSSGERLAYFRGLVHYDMARLTPTAWKVVSTIAIEQARKHTQTDKAQSFSLRELTARTGLAKASVVRAIHEAVDLGVLTHERGPGRQPSAYRVIWPQQRKALLSNAGALVAPRGSIVDVDHLPPRNSSPAARAFTEMKDLGAVDAYLSSLRARGPAGEVAALLFGAQRSSSEAKLWRPGGSGSRRRYESKAEALRDLTRALTEYAGALGITWGWARDMAAIRSEDLQRRSKIGEAQYRGPTWLFYADLPFVGQVSFHARRRGSGPDYDSKWDGSGDSVERILRYCDIVNDEEGNLP